LGQNDVGEPDSLSYPVMCVLDPLKIEGKIEASDSRGFGLSLSSAEMYIIRFPLTDMNYLWASNGYVRSVNESTTNGVKTFGVWIAGVYGEDGNPIFEYIFSENMNIIEVKFISGTNRLRKQFADQGKLTGTLDQEYLGNLKNSVHYWNGKEWQKEWTMVKH
ncbi:MAG: hypothetical protein HY800_03465, partial [Ignavibacteriales bacterium]|nr:hypothetical protein [Ignavibacteriales bacterium]